MEIKTFKWKLLYFYSNTCQPCKLMGPIIKDVIETVGDIMLQKVNTSERIRPADDYGVSAVPTFILINDAGIEVSRRIGLQPRPQLIEWIKSHV